MKGVLKTGETGGCYFPCK